jgi:hypothetical protein
MCAEDEHTMSLGAMEKRREPRPKSFSRLPGVCSDVFHFALRKHHQRMEFPFRNGTVDIS